MNAVLYKNTLLYQNMLGLLSDLCHIINPRLFGGHLLKCCLGITAGRNF